MELSHFFAEIRHKFVTKPIFACIFQKKSLKMPFKNRTPSLKNFMIRGSSGSAREIKNVAIVKIRKSDDFLGVRQINLARQLHIAPKITAKKPEITDFFVFLNCVVLTIASKFALLTIKGFSGAPVKTRTRISSSEDCCVIHYTTRAGCKISEFLEREHSNPHKLSPKLYKYNIGSSFFMPFCTIFYRIVKCLNPFIYRMFSNFTLTKSIIQHFAKKT